MSEKENAPVRVRARTRAGQEKRQGEAALSYADCTTMAASSQPGGQISTLLLKGEENAIPGSQLARMAGVSPRRLRLMIDLERLKRPICASDHGYFLHDVGSKGARELRRFVLRQDSRCAANRRATKTARAALRMLERGPIDGQETLFGGGGE